MLRQFIELLSWGYEKYLDIVLDKEHITIGDSTGVGKVSFHVMVYDGIHAWDNGLSKQPPFTSSQRHFVELLKNESLQNPSR